MANGFHIGWSMARKSLGRKNLTYTNQYYDNAVGRSACRKINIHQQENLKEAYTESLKIRGTTQPQHSGLTNIVASNIYFCT